MFPQACDLSARTDSADDRLARKILVGTFCELACRSPRFPQCLLLDVQPIGESRHTTDDYTDVYPGVYEGLPVDLKVMQGYGAQILDSRVSLSRFGVLLSELNMFHSLFAKTWRYGALFPHRTIFFHSLVFHWLPLLKGRMSAWCRPGLKERRLPST